MLPDRPARCVVLTLLVFLSCAAASHAQTVGAAAAEALAYAQGRPVELERFDATDLVDLAVTTAYRDERLGVEYVYLQQRLAGVPIRGALASVALRDGRVRSFTHSFLPDLAQRADAGATAVIGDAAAVALAAQHLGVRAPTLAAPALAVPAPAAGSAPPPSALTAPGTAPARDLRRGYPVAANEARLPVTVEDYYLRLADGRLRRCRGVGLAPQGTVSDYLVSVDVATGQVLQSVDRTTHCAFGEGYLHGYGAVAKPPPQLAPSMEPARDIAGDGARYRVFPWPTESPSHGPHTLVAEPADDEASPYGWHDTDGRAGAEYTITRGNNTHAYLDGQDADDSAGDEPVGGPSLRFDFPYAAGDDAAAQADAAVVNLFYGVNRMHDLAHHYGFTEAAGNFQALNYGGGGLGGDHVIAHSQDGGRIIDGLGPDVDHVNNANFSTRPDGTPGVLQMYLWSRTRSAELLTVAAPAALAGKRYGPTATVSGGWGDGALVDERTAVRAGLTRYDDGVAEPSATDACEPAANAAALAGRIAVLDRGQCQFGLKARHAQAAGAVAVLVCNGEPDVINMAPGSDGDAVTIPVLLLTSLGCDTLLLDLAANPGLELTIRQPDNAGPRYISGSFDNGIVAHEYAHGISTRLTGGPNETTCLYTDDAAEQMGEGWSDFFALASTARPEATRDTPRGVGTFAIGQPTTGRGIRNHPYTTDMAINPATYASVADPVFSQPHGIGSVWATMLWDLYWDLIDAHGRSGDLLYGTGGDNRALALVVQGLKLQPCLPDFVSGRDAILAADSLLYDGEDDALIWRTFARRGLGYGADAGDPYDRFDATESFELPPIHTNLVYLDKVATPNILPGGTVEVALTVSNWRAAALAGAVLTDQLPAGSELVEVSGADATFRADGGSITLGLPTLRQGDTFALRYRYTAPQTAPTLLYHEPVRGPGAAAGYTVGNLQPDAPGVWAIATGGAGYGDDAAWAANWTETASEPTLAMGEGAGFRVSVGAPVLSFYHQYGLTDLVEGAVLEVKTTRVPEWTIVPAESFLRGGYPGEVSARAFSTPVGAGYRGESSGWEQVVVDLAAYRGETVRVRWRAGRAEYDSNLARDQRIGRGWLVDEIAGLDVVSYNPTASVLLGSDTLVVARAPDLGTFVDYRLPDATAVAEHPGDVALIAYPNPTSGVVSVAFPRAETPGTLELLAADGRSVARHDVAAGAESVTLGLGHHAPGVYVARLTCRGQTSRVRLVRR